jgi:hypothetical protein
VLAALEHDQPNRLRHVTIRDQRWFSIDQISTLFLRDADEVMIVSPSIGTLNGRIAK